MKIVYSIEHGSAIYNILYFLCHPEIDLFQLATSTPRLSSVDRAVVCSVLWILPI